MMQEQKLYCKKKTMMRLGTGTYGTDSTASPTHSFHRQGQRARHVTPLAMASLA